MAANQAEVFSNISCEFQTFSIKLKEMLNQEKDDFTRLLEIDENGDHALEEYGFTSFDQAPNTVLEILVE